MECVAVLNQKGGVGKTTTAVNLGAAVAQHGTRLLFIDLDPQGHLTTHLGLDAAAPGHGIYEVLTRDLPFEKAIHRYSDNISVVPAQIDLAAAEVELVSVVGREVLLRDLLSVHAAAYDMVIIDCPPSLGVLTLNALSASTYLLIPLQAHFLALQGVGKLLETVSLVSQRINPRLKVAGMVMCMYEAGTRLAGEVIDDLDAYLASSRETNAPWKSARILQTRIRRNVKLAECPSYGQSIFEYAPKSNGALDYLALAEEFLSLVGMKLATPIPPVAVPDLQIEPPGASAPVPASSGDLIVAAAPAARHPVTPAPKPAAPTSESVVAVAPLVTQPVPAGPKLAPAPAEPKSDEINVVKPRKAVRAAS